MLALGFQGNVWNGHGSEQGLGVRVQGVIVKIRPGSYFGDLAQIHDRHAITDVPDH
jgi:hypothetical protein